MTEANLRLGSPPPATLAEHESSLLSLPSPDVYAQPTVALLTRANARAAANEDAVASLDGFRNPLWIVAIGMACMFGVMALVIALG